MPDDCTTLLQQKVDRLRAGDPAALDQLLDHAYNRLQRLAHRMLGDFQRLRTWEDSGDVVHRAYPRLRAALESVRLSSVCDFFRLAGTCLRRELIDLSRQYFGPEGEGARRAASPEPLGREETSRPLAEGEQSTYDPARLAQWREFHEHVESLPDEERAVFDLIWYGELTQAQAASLLGVAEITVRRRWLAARLLLQQALRWEGPLR